MDKTIYALGFFDGVHIGHQALLRACRNLAKEHGTRTGVVTFANHPDALVFGAAPGLINTPEDRELLLTVDYAMDTVVTLPFDRTLQDTPWDAFLENLILRFGAAGFVCGEDFRFGHRGEGSADTLSAFCRERGLPYAVVPEQLLEGIRVSSTYIRGLIEAGDMGRTADFLGHPYRVTGTVRHGKQLGRKLGFPTANMAFPDSLARPRFGVYACIARLQEGDFPAVTNLGLRPTVDGQSVTVESWLLDYEGELYGRELTLDFHSFLRPERKFETLDAMRDEIFRNAQQARDVLQGKQ